MFNADIRAAGVIGDSGGCMSTKHAQKHTTTATPSTGCIKVVSISAKIKNK